MKCPNCGMEAESGAKFCLRCGAALTPEVARAPGGAPPSEYIYGAPPTITGDSAPPPAYGAPPPVAPYGALPPQPWQPPHTLTPVRKGLGPLGILALAGAATLLLLAVVGLFWVSSRGTGRPASAPAVVTTPVESGFQPTTDVERAIVAAVQANNNAQIAALQQADPAPLAGKMTGSALTDNQQMVKELQDQGLAQDARLIHIEYSKPAIQNGTQATIRTVEQWESSFRQVSTGKVVQTVPPQTLHEIYYLTLQNGAWLVERVDILENPAATPDPNNQT
jgi:hypothetical protein